MHNTTTYTAVHPHAYLPELVGVDRERHAEGVHALVLFALQRAPREDFLGGFRDGKYTKLTSARERGSQPYSSRSQNKG